MAHQWKAGDLAVCVDVSEIEPGCGWAHDAANCPPIKSTLRIFEILQDDECGCIFAILDGGYGALLQRLRPVLPASRKFTEQMRSLKPKVEAA